MKTYPLIISEYFPAYHPRAGEETNFIPHIRNGVKIHTIRNNWGFWQKRILDIWEGKAYLSMRVWEGRPYQSKQKEVASMYGYGVGLERLEFDRGYQVLATPINLEELANNDGLSLRDFEYWFKGGPPTPCAIIHFTDFRYARI